MTTILAIDQGTTSTRAIAFTVNGQAEVIAQIRHQQNHPAPRHVEQDGAELLANIRAVIAEARDRLGAIDAIGLCNQGESCLAWDAQTGLPLSPVITWQDSRTGPRLQVLADRGHADLIRARSGLPLDPYFSASKLGWLMEQPQVQAAHAAGRLRLGTTDAFFLDRLTSCFATDPSTASRTGLMALADLAWDPELCALFGVPFDALPPIRPTSGDFGQLDGIPILASIVDQQAALFGHGCRAPGEMKITFGTGAFALALTGTMPPDPPEGLLPTVAWSQVDCVEGNAVYALDGGVYDAGSAIDWALRAGIARDHGDFDDFDRAPAIDRGLVFVPAFSGLAAPHWDRSAAPLILGFDTGSDGGDLCQALLEGIALLTAEAVDLIARHDIDRPGTQLCPQISIDGGLSRSRYFCRFLATVTRRTIVTHAFDELSAFGAAGLAARALGTGLQHPGGAQRQSHGPIPDVTAAQVMAWRHRFREATERARGWRQP